MMEQSKLNHIRATAEEVMRVYSKGVTGSIETWARIANEGAIKIVELIDEIESTK